MATTSPVLTFVRLANVLTTTLLRVGVKLVGPGDCPLYLFTVRGRKSGQPRTTPIAVFERDGKRYLLAPYGRVDWVRNLLAAGEATLTRGRRAEQFRAIELPTSEGGFAQNIYRDWQPDRALLWHRRRRLARGVRAPDDQPPGVCIAERSCDQRLRAAQASTSLRSRPRTFRLPSPRRGTGSEGEAFRLPSPRRGTGSEGRHSGSPLPGVGEGQE